MKPIYILIVYWLVAIILTYVVRFYNGKKHIDWNKIFPSKEPQKKNYKIHILIWLVAPMLIPFAVVIGGSMLVAKTVKKFYYKNRPRPVPKKYHSVARKDTVMDETNTTISLAEYNYKHNSNFTIDQVYGKGYEASLTDDERASINERMSQFGILKIEPNLPDSCHTVAATALGEAMFSGDFTIFDSMLAEDVETIIYKNREIVGKKEVSEYWKGWWKRFVVTKDLTRFEVCFSNYYSNVCFQAYPMVVLFMMNGDKISKMVLAERHISPGIHYHDDFVKDTSFTLDFIKEFLRPIPEPNEIFSPVAKEYRLPCMSCGEKSELLDWHGAYIESGPHGYRAEVSICPKCGKVVEFLANIRFS